MRRHSSQKTGKEGLCTRSLVTTAIMCIHRGIKENSEDSHDRAQTGHAEEWPQQWHCGPHSKEPWRYWLERSKGHKISARILEMESNESHWDEEEQELNEPKQELTSPLSMEPQQSGSHQLVIASQGQGSRPNISGRHSSLMAIPRTWSSDTPDPAPLGLRVSFHPNDTEAFASETKGPHPSEWHN